MKIEITGEITVWRVHPESSEHWNFISSFHDNYKQHNWCYELNSALHPCFTCQLSTPLDLIQLPYGPHTNSWVILCGSLQTPTSSAHCTWGFYVNQLQSMSETLLPNSSPLLALTITSGQNNQENGQNWGFENLLSSTFAQILNRLWILTKAKPDHRTN